MRIIGGSLKGRRFQPPNNIPARPTTDFAKEGLFNVIGNFWDFVEVRFLDLFAGTGSISYEFASRGCRQITTVEQDNRLAEFIRRMTEELELPIHLARMDVFKFMERDEGSYDLIFAGPPYPLENLEEIPTRVISAGLLAPKGWLILEHNPKHEFSAEPYFRTTRKYGTTIFSIFVLEEPEE